MPLNPDRVGHHYPAFRYEVSREKVREYARATGWADPGDDGDVVAPPTFAACFTVGRAGEALLGDPELGAHPGLVHSSQEYELHRPLRTGDVLACTPRIAAIVSRGRLELLTLEVECVDAGSGDPAVTSRGTLVFLPPAPREGR